jgi:membrane-anchored glycerophosphoryl diester phosphodiesterase (GDPDase)
MNMTHYMELLATNQPWNLLIFMAIPIVLAVGSYLIGGLPLIYIAFQELGWVNTQATDETKRHAHAICVALFLIFGHIAMIAGMLDPSLLGYVSDGMSEVHNH